MIYGAELHFDEKTESTILGVWAELCDRGITSSMFDAGARPHATIAVWDQEVDLAKVEQAIAGFCAAMPPLPAVIQSVGNYITSPGVIFFAPVVTGPMIDFHNAFHRCISDFPATRYLPGQWDAHCGVAIGLEEPQVAQAMEICRGVRTPIEGVFTRIALGRYPPTTYLAEYELTG